MMDEKKTYKNDYNCENCGRVAIGEIPFGTLRPKAVICNYCGCVTDGTLVPTETAPSPEKEPELKEYHFMLERVLRRYARVTACNESEARSKALDGADIMGPDDRWKTAYTKIVP